MSASRGRRRRVSVSRFAKEKLRLAKSRSGSIGCAARLSHSTNSPNRASPPISENRISGSLQPRCGSSMRANTGPPRPRTHSTPPRSSTRARSFPVARGGTAYATSAAVTIANGTLTRNTQRQPAFVTSQPPTSGPITNAIPVHAVHDPIAAPRASPLNVAAITASPAGVRTAPSAPCSPRATISVVPSGAAAQRTDVMPKPMIPSRNSRRAPKRSPSDPPTSSSEPSVRRYASTTHCCSASPPPRSSLDRRERDVDDRRVHEDDDGAEDARDEHQAVAARSLQMPGGQQRRLARRPENMCAAERAPVAGNSRAGRFSREPSARGGQTGCTMQAAAVNG